MKKNYKYGFHTKAQFIHDFEEILSEDLIRKISDIKKEPKWMLDLRLKAYKIFLNMEQPNFGPDLTKIDFKDYKYYKSISDEIADDWNSVDSNIKDAFEKIGIIDAENKYLSGSATQFDSGTIYKNLPKELMDKGVIFSNIEVALQTHEDLVKKYFGTLVSYADNKYAALNTAIWSGGTFIYVPKNIVLEKPIQSYFRINSQSLGQFERTLIIVDEYSTIHYIEGCTASIYENDNLHAAVVEVFVHENSTCRYSTIQNWSNNVLNLVTKRAKVFSNSNMLWIDGNLGSRINMKYPCSILFGDNSSSDCISLAIAGKDSIQDTGAKMIHIGKNTKSRIISKSISLGGGKNVFRGLVDIKKNALRSHAYVECDSLLIDNNSKSDAIPYEKVGNNLSNVDHEARITTISAEKLEYLIQKGLSYNDAEEILILGFANEFDSELPMEYAIEFNQLLKTCIGNRNNN